MTGSIGSKIVGSVGSVTDAEPGAVTAADVTAIQTEIIPSGSRANRAPTTYPTDAAGNGGGGKGENV